jgi:hypothetical protein
MQQWLRNNILFDPEGAASRLNSVLLELTTMQTMGTGTMALLRLGNSVRAIGCEIFPQGKHWPPHWHTLFEPWVLADVCAVLEMERMQLSYAMHKEIERHAVAIQEGQ